MKLSRVLALVLSLSLLLGTSAFAAASDYPTISWPRIDFVDGETTGSIGITIEGVVGKQIEEGQTELVADMSIPVVDLYEFEEVYKNEDGTYTVLTADGEAVLTRDELIEKYADPSVQIIPVINGATMTIKNLSSSEPIFFFPGGYVFIDEEKTILAKAFGQLADYSTNSPFVFDIDDDVTNGMNNFAIQFPVFGLVIDGNRVNYVLLTVTEEKAEELLATLSEGNETQENEEVAENTQEDEEAAEEPQENEATVVETVYTVLPTTTKFEVNGNPVAMEAYLIENNNYVKLRDIAMAVNGTTKQFNVTWNQEEFAVYMYSNTAYEPVGGEMAAGDGASKTAKVTVAKIYKDNEEVSFTAFNINGNNYFKLRDIAKAFDIGVIWDGETFTAKIDTNSSYEE